jgi:radical SAM enzyme (TIGR01210 family)
MTVTPLSRDLDGAGALALRTGKLPVDPWRALGHFWEDERQAAGGATARVLTVFLGGAECPFGCVFCDLWRQTLEGPTPRGALPVQLERALEAAGEIPGGAQIKLYNASNFFDPRAVPVEDQAGLAALVAPFAQVIVECHPRLVGERAVRFAGRLAGRLQVAMGLETVHPEALPRLGKGMTLDHFAQATDRLRASGIGVRAFVLVGAPFVPAEEAPEWAARSTAWAFAHGVEHVALIPVRGDWAAMHRLAATGDFTAPTAAIVEEAFRRSLQIGGGVVTLDTWDLERWLDCPSCRAARRTRLERMNLSGTVEPPVACERCQ